MGTSYVCRRLESYVFGYLLRTRIFYQILELSKPAPLLHCCHTVSILTLRSLIPVTSLAFAGVLGLTFARTLWFVFYVVFVDCIFAGIIVATFFWLVTNRFLRNSQLDPDIEWGYAFDVHLNAFFPPLVILHFFQLFFYGWLVLRSELFLSRLLGNTFWLLAFSYYIYITFLGYNCE